MSRLKFLKKAANNVIDMFDDKPASKINGTFLQEDLPPEVKIPNKHKVSYDKDDNLIEEGYNYRLSGADDIIYRVEEGKVVGHLGLKESDEGLPKVVGVNVDEPYQRKGIAYDLYKFAKGKLGTVVSDDADAMEPEAKKLWEKLVKEGLAEKLHDGTFQTIEGSRSVLETKLNKLLNE